MVVYKDSEKFNDSWIRVFNNDVDVSELVWHRDFENRSVEVLEGVGWRIQLDNKLPEDLICGSTYLIPKMMFHRLIKGQTKLKLRIKENESLQIQ